MNAGQIPQLLYRLPSQDGATVRRKPEHCEPAHVLSRQFSLGVTPECFEALLRLLSWSWSTFCAAVHDTRDLRGATIRNSRAGSSVNAALLDVQRLVYVSTACLRLINVFINQCYPLRGGNGGASGGESSRLAECIGDTRDLLKKILVDSRRQVSLSPRHRHVDDEANLVDSATVGNRNLNSAAPSAVVVDRASDDVTHTAPRNPPTTNPQRSDSGECLVDDVTRIEQQLAAHARSIVDECHQAFVASFHAFYPSTHLKWNCLCDLLNLLEPVSDNAFTDSVITAPLCG